MARCSSCFSRLLADYPEYKESGMLIDRTRSRTSYTPTTVWCAFVTTNTAWHIKQQSSTSSDIPISIGHCVCIKGRDFMKWSHRNMFSDVRPAFCVEVITFPRIMARQTEDYSNGEKLLFQNTRWRLLISRVFRCHKCVVHSHQFRCILVWWLPKFKMAAHWDLHFVVESFHSKINVLCGVTLYVQRPFTFRGSAAMLTDSYRQVRTMWTNCWSLGDCIPTLNLKVSNHGRHT